ncbi:hypothetical protein BJ508DRAFT_24604 [Ascobolus immersus RN42]|uniref:Uncharacterized protein n=1 Tax=Ascobolus immersus RN42 TaxID=1160509 RepID=A0A3N4HMM1_ASCIM|nr:hypothetical protein BJ508DRAFT_24604 [Ascobolus immersus RN42]
MEHNELARVCTSVYFVGDKYHKCDEADLRIRYRDLEGYNAYIPPRTLASESHSEKFECYFEEVPHQTLTGFDLLATLFRPKLPRTRSCGCRYGQDGLFVLSPPVFDALSNRPSGPSRILEHIHWGTKMNYSIDLTIRKELELSTNSEYPKRLFEIMEEFIIFLHDEISPFIARLWSNYPASDLQCAFTKPVSDRVRCNLEERSNHGLLRDEQIHLIEARIRASMAEMRMVILKDGTFKELMLIFRMLDTALKQFFLVIRSERIEQLTIKYLSDNSDANSCLVRKLERVNKLFCACKHMVLEFWKTMGIFMMESITAMDAGLFESDKRLYIGVLARALMEELDERGISESWYNKFVSSRGI